MPWPRPSDRVAELLREGARRVLEASDAMFASIDAASLAGHDPAVREDPVLLGAFHRANRAMIDHWARANEHDPGAEVSPYVGEESLTLAFDLVRRGLDARMLEPYRAGQNAAWQVWMQIAFALTTDPAELRELLDVSARSIFSYVDATMAATSARIERERDQLTRGTNAERLETVTLVLDEAPIDVRRAARRLGYDFERSHVAAIVWSDEADRPRAGRGPRAVAPVPHAAERAAEAVAAAAGAQRPLTVAASSAALWAWVAAAHEPDPAALERALEAIPGVRVALGPRARGVAGFRRSHADAFAAQRLVVRLGSPLRVARYADLKVVSLVTQDAERARAFVTETLGELAGAPPALRDTLRTYLHLQSNATRTAGVLFTHRNTVVSRIARAEELLPRPLADSAFDVAVALEVMHWSA